MGSLTALLHKIWCKWYSAGLGPRAEETDNLYFLPPVILTCGSQPPWRSMSALRILCGEKPKPYEKALEDEIPCGGRDAKEHWGVRCIGETYEPSLKWIDSSNDPISSTNGSDTSCPAEVILKEAEFSTSKIWANEIVVWDTKFSDGLSSSNRKQEQIYKYLEKVCYHYKNL